MVKKRVVSHVCEERERKREREREREKEREQIKPIYQKSGIMMHHRESAGPTP
jgi:hypothetical protein